MQLHVLHCLCVQLLLHSREVERSPACMLTFMFGLQLLASGPRLMNQSSALCANYKKASHELCGLMLHRAGGRARATCLQDL